ncbi:hypothetical protein GALMADRAFT_215523 [Galerina marginata CBS 339.88]|uniref:Uncharacterized protein n=1 Tax=Galerina marginata (strain CBS 339.88) TaxID=685588 RepID=A0A067SDI1_GALM3|nr:hypothetical protein GALMADRAFT_215523 [Galerina marginata CBS 339.88]
MAWAVGIDGDHAYDDDIDDAANGKEMMLDLRGGLVTIRIRCEDGLIQLRSLPGRAQCVCEVIVTAAVYMSVLRAGGNGSLSIQPRATLRKLMALIQAKGRGGGVSKMGCQGRLAGKSSACKTAVGLSFVGPSGVKWRYVGCECHQQLNKGYRDLLIVRSNANQIRSYGLAGEYAPASSEFEESSPDTMTSEDYSSTIVAAKPTSPVKASVHNVRKEQQERRAKGSIAVA